MGGDQRARSEGFLASPWCTPSNRSQKTAQTGSSPEATHVRVGASPYLRVNFCDLHMSSSTLVVVVEFFRRLNEIGIGFYCTLATVGRSSE